MDPIKCLVGLSKYTYTWVIQLFSNLSTSIHCKLIRDSCLMVTMDTRGALTHTSPCHTQGAPRGVPNGGSQWGVPNGGLYSCSISLGSCLLSCEEWPSQYCLLSRQHPQRAWIMPWPGHLWEIQSNFSS